jgi:hypothetical protein
MQFYFWPIFYPAKWRAAIAAMGVELQPGFAWADVSAWRVLRNRQIRRLALQMYVSWALLTVLALAGILSDIMHLRWAPLSLSFSLLMFLAPVAIGLSTAAVSGLPFISVVLLVLLSILRSHEYVYWTFAGLLILFTTLLTARFARQESLKHKFVKVIVSPLIALAAISVLVGIIGILIILAVGVWGAFVTHQLSAFLLVFELAGFGLTNLWILVVVLLSVALLFWAGGFVYSLLYISVSAIVKPG